MVHAMRLTRSHLGAVYRLEFSMIELERLKAEPPPLQPKASETLQALADLARTMEATETHPEWLRYQDDPDV